MLSADDEGMGRIVHGQECGNPSLDDVFFGFAHCSRRSVITVLRRRPSTVSDLCEAIYVPPQGVYAHIKILKRAGIVRSIRKDGAQLLYLDDRQMLKALRFLASQIVLGRQ